MADQKGGYSNQEVHDIVDIMPVLTENARAREIEGRMGRCNHNAAAI